ncbi:MAG: CocE/NonD family hydrolase [Anaerolineae bacterium]|nr:CocE/NonD family hydrolase [Anaerolineae bacterium]
MSRPVVESIVTEFDVPARMRDGVALRANIFRPATGGPYPVALTRTPYGKDFASVSPILDAVRLARAGYIVVIQDVRGRFASEGGWAPMRHEHEDGYDSVEWAARLPNADGQVGMFGASYFGFTQWAAAAEQPPSLKAIVPSVTWSDPLDGIAWRGGAFELGLMAHWHLNSLSLDIFQKRYADASPAEMMFAAVSLVRTIDSLRTDGYWSLPLKDFEPLQRVNVGVPDLEVAVERPYDPDAVAYMTPRREIDRVTVPALNLGGWYDIFTQGTLQNFNALRDHGTTPPARQSRLVIGPWSHVNYGHVIGEQDFGFVSMLAFMNLQTDLTGLTQRWFDHWLKGIDTGITQEPPVRLFIMGDNVWRDEHEWPLARTQYTPYYLHSHGSANTLHGNGHLSPEPPAAEPPDEYLYDPANPVPTHGGALLLHPLFRPGVADQRPIEVRQDVLVYTSAPLDRDLEVTGPVTVTLWITSDAPDTDFVARLVDVHPDGFAQNLADGIRRARYRHGHQPQWLTTGEPTEMHIDLWATANVFKAGHRIRVDVTSSSFPRWDRNPNTGAPWGQDADLQPAHNQVLHDAAHPSHILLPVIPPPD